MSPLCFGRSLRQQIPELVKRVYRAFRDYVIPTRAPQIQRARREVRKRLVRFPQLYRVHLGCGLTRFEGWVNLDRYDTNIHPDLLWDLTLGMPFEDSTCQFLYCEHLLEHFSIDEGLELLREGHRVLAPGGVFRIAMPSLDVLIEKSYHGTWRDQAWLKMPEFQFIKTRAEMLNISFRWWEHKWLYDREELHRRLEEAGFSTIRDVSWGESSIRDLRHLETRADSLLICEVEKS